MAKLFGQAFIKALEERTKSTKSRVIHAMDIADTLPPGAPDSARRDLVERACHHAAAVEPHIVALKLNYPLVLATGLEIAHHIKTVTPNLPLIADFKVADIDNTNAWIARHTYAAGIDAIIVQGFIGDDAIQAVLNEARKYGDRGVILVVDMSHPGSLQFIHPQTPKLAKLAVKLKVTGVISPGTRPPHVRDIRTWVGPDTLVLAPGVGAQGGKPGSAIAAGADYEIIGRSIYQAEDPAQTAREFAKQTFQAGKKRDTGPTQKERFIRKVALLLDDVGAIKFGSFTLASGKKSPYYIDLRIVPSFPDAFSRLTDLFVEWLAGHPKVSFDRIAGVPTAGISFATALGQHLNTPMLYVRSQPKKYGRQQRVEGILKKGDKVLVVDDLITDGGSKLTVVQSLRDAGAKVSDVLVVVDREQGGADQLAKEKLTLHSLAPITQIIRALFAEKRLSQEETNGILTYIAEDR
jgi:uridine monophosphate synthetase